MPVQSDGYDCGILFCKFMLSMYQSRCMVVYIRSGEGREHKAVLLARKVAWMGNTKGTI
jgi:Ulp1 family protease